MSWLAHLTGNVQPPAWRGPSALHLKLSAGDVGVDLADDEEKPAAYRTCSNCLRPLPLTKHYFFVNRREKGGFMYECKECHKARDRAAALRRSAEKVLSEQEFRQMAGAA